MWRPLSPSCPSSAARSSWAATVRAPPPTLRPRPHRPGRALCRVRLAAWGGVREWSGQAGGLGGEQEPPFDPPRPPPPTPAGAFMDAGVEQIYGLGELNDYEKAGLKAMMPELRASIEKGECGVVRACVRPCVWVGDAQAVHFYREGERRSQERA